MIYTGGNFFVKRGGTPDNLAEKIERV